MAIGHKRINDPRPNPNPNITFIRALGSYDDSDKALHILQSLAAQFRPISQDRGYSVNSFEEVEYNGQFQGKNFNAGETIEIVLRRKNGTFVPYTYLLFVMAHELAHISEMNHSHAFRKVNEAIRKELNILRAKGYFGDGFWGKGRKLVSGRDETELADDDQPPYTCGGAYKKRRGGRKPPKGSPGKPKGAAAKLGQTGRQTAIAPKPGGRVRKANAFNGEGHILDADPEQSSFRRQAGSKSAAEMRAIAAEARLQKEKSLVKSEAGPSSPKKSFGNFIDLCSSDEEEEDEDDEEEEDIKFTAEEKDWMRKDNDTWKNGGIAKGNGDFDSDSEEED